MDMGGSREGPPDWLGKTKKAKKPSVVSVTPWSWVANAVVVALIMTMPAIFVILTGRLNKPAVWVKSTEAGLGAPRESKKDELLGGLLLPGFDEQSCVSRYQSVYYRKNMTRSPTPYLIKRLREQEALQRRCGPGTEPYRRASERLKSGQKYVDTVDGCGYLVLLSYRGLGNRILSMVSGFLYAMLTNRVLLVDRGANLPELFCEPFPAATWLLLLDFPLEGYKDLWESAEESYENVTMHNNTGPVSEHRFVYLHLDHAATPANKLLYCDDHRQYLHRVQWVVLRMDSYMPPSLFLNPVYQEELDWMFPRKDSVFYIISRYLFHPTNHVWGMVTGRASLRAREPSRGFRPRRTCGCRNEPAARKRSSPPPPTTAATRGRRPPRPRLPDRRAPPSSSSPPLPAPARPPATATHGRLRSRGASPFRPPPTAPHRRSTAAQGHPSKPGPHPPS